MTFISEAYNIDDFWRQFLSSKIIDIFINIA